MQRLQYPFMKFDDQHGDPLDAGKVYVGAANGDPELSPISVFWDAALTIPATQPLRTRGGEIVNNGSPAIPYVAGADYSMRVRDSAGRLVRYAATATDTSAAAYQPLAAALIELSAIDPSTIGLAILAATDAAAVKTLLSIISGLPLTGGTVSGNITRQGAGPHLYHNDPALTSGRVFLTAAGASDPTTTAGDVWLTY